MRKQSVAFFVVLLAIFLLSLVMLGGCSSAGEQAEAPSKPPETPASTQGSSAAEAEAKLPSMMTWAAYDVGASGYQSVGIVANALTEKFGVNIRILPSGTSVGRMIPLKTGTVSYTFGGDEAIYAMEAMFEFGTYEWGPQDLRVVLVPTVDGCLFTRADSGIKTVADAKGKKVPYVPGAPTVNQKLEALLAFGGVTMNDVQKVEIPSYGATLKAVIEGTVDLAYSSPTAPTLEELAASPHGIHYLPMPATDKEGWARVQKVVPWLFPKLTTEGAGITQPIELMEYGYPIVTTYASRDANEVYALVKAIDETYDTFKGSSPAMKSWDLKLSGVRKTGVPFHEGAVKYLKEKGIWTADMDEYNKQQEARIAKLQQAWEKTLQEATTSGVAEKDFPAFWAQKKKELGGDF